MIHAFQAIYDELKEKALRGFQVTGVVAPQIVAITRNLIRIPFDRGRAIVPAGVLSVAAKGYVQVPDAIKEGLVIAVFMTHQGNISKHELFDIQPDFLHLDHKNFLWFELNSRITTIREAYYIDYNTTPPELQPIPNEKFSRAVENEVETLFSLNS